MNFVFSDTSSIVRSSSTNRGFVSGEVKLLDLEEEELEAESARNFYAGDDFTTKSTSFANPHYMSPEVLLGPSSLSVFNFKFDQITGSVDGGQEKDDSIQHLAA